MSDDKLPRGAPPIISAPRSSPDRPPGLGRSLFGFALGVCGALAFEALAVGIGAAIVYYRISSSETAMEATFALGATLATAIATGVASLVSGGRGLAGPLAGSVLWIGNAMGPILAWIGSAGGPVRTEVVPFAFLIFLVGMPLLAMVMVLAATRRRPVPRPNA